MADELEEAFDLMDDKEWPEAWTLLHDLNRRYPRQPEVLYALAQVCLELPDMPGYERACRDLVEVAPPDPDTTLALAGAHLVNVHPFQAVQTFRGFLEKWPDHERASEVRATLDSLEPNLPTLLSELGVEGPDAFEVAALHEEAHALVTAGYPTEARRVIERILRRAPDLVPALNNLSQAYAMEGRFDLAIRTAERALAVDPENAHALSNLSRYFLFTGRPDEARQTADRMLAITRGRPEIWVKKAEALSYLGDDHGVLEAVAGAERSVAGEPLPDAGILYHLAAVASLRLGDEAEARRFWKRALDEQPGLLVARENLDDLRKPVGQWHAPWPFALANWLSQRSSQALVEVSGRAADGADTETVRRGARRVLRQIPDVEAVVPYLLDRGDPMGRELAVRLAALAGTPAMLEELRAFAFSQRGPDSLRHQALLTLREAGLIQEDTVRMWARGDWSDIKLITYEVTSEPAPSDRTDEFLDRLGEALDALRAGESARGEAILRELLEIEPNAPDLRFNLAAAYEAQGRKRESRALIEEIHRQHPDYFFARVSMAKLAIERRRFDEARVILQPLQSQTKFHIDEFVHYAGTMVELALGEGDLEAARSWVDMLHKMARDHPATAHWETQVLLKETGGSTPRQLAKLWRPS